MSILSLSEVEVVLEFAPICPYGIIPTSIEKREPPEPDVRCQISDGSWVAFEITESIYDGVAKQQDDSIFMKRRIEDYVENFNNKDYFYKKFNNAMIFIYPKDRKLDKKYFSKNIGQLVQYLLNNAPEEREFTFPDNKFNGEIARGIFDGPIYETNYGNDFSDSVLKRIESKFNKTYQTNIPMELLIHYHMQPGPFSWDVNKAFNFIRQNLKNSPFRRAWIFSIKGKKVLCVFPTIKG